VRNLETGQDRKLTHKGSWAKGERASNMSSISPDGRHVAYVWTNVTAERYEIWLVNTDGTGDRCLYQNDKASYLEPQGWSPDGKRLAVTEYGQDAKTPSRILLIDRMGAESRFVLWSRDLVL
jgi:Tol biopolymer transport system component